MRVRPHPVLAVVLLIPSLAIAAEPAIDESRSELTTRHGVGVTLGLGATSYIDGAAREMAGDQIGFYTELRLIYGTRTRFAGEAAFVRSGRPLPVGRRRAGGHTIYGHGFEALLRVNHPGHRGSLFYSPFAVMGLGWTDFRHADDRDPSSVSAKVGGATTLPVGVGCAVGYRVFYAEVRFMYRPTLAESGFVDEGGPSMQAWFSGLSVGVEF